MDMVCDCLLCIVQFKFGSSLCITMLRVLETDPPIVFSGICRN